MRLTLVVPALVATIPCSSGYTMAVPTAVTSTSPYRTVQGGTNITHSMKNSAKTATSSLEGPGGYNYCGHSTNTDTTTEQSPPAQNCTAFADYLDKNVGWWKLKELEPGVVQRLGGLGTCRFGITVAEWKPENMFVMIGSQDVVDIVREAVEKWKDPVTELVGAAGAMKCNGTLDGEVNWVLDSWIVY